jgi:hypothetical protein
MSIRRILVKSLKELKKKRIHKRWKYNELKKKILRRKPDWEA